MRFYYRSKRAKFAVENIEHRCQHLSTRRVPAKKSATLFSIRFYSFSLLCIFFCIYYYVPCKNPVHLSNKPVIVIVTRISNLTGEILEHSTKKAFSGFAILFAAQRKSHNCHNCVCFFQFAWYKWRTEINNDIAKIVFTVYCVKHHTDKHFLKPL